MTNSLKRLWFSSPIYPAARSMRLAVQRLVMCSRGLHDTHPVVPGEDPTNFCHACGKLMNPKAFGVWEVGLRDGTAREVRATNVQHAKNLVIYGERSPGEMAFARLGEFKTHPRNIVTVKRLRDG